MDYAIVTGPAAAMRRKARHQSEMISQLLFGEAVKVLKEKWTGWTRVRGLHDNYEGWVSTSLLQEVKEKDVDNTCVYVTEGLLNTLHIGGMSMYVPFGASLPGYEKGEGRLGKLSYGFQGNLMRRGEQEPDAVLLERLTTPWLNAPYLWGGRTQFGVDCSGFVQVIFKMMGFDLPRDAWQQAQEGKTVKKLKDAVCGDLAFFDDKEEIVHVGILLNNQQIIHASGKVRIDHIDKNGIIRSDGTRTHTLQSLKRRW